MSDDVNFKTSELPILSVAATTPESNDAKLVERIKNPIIPGKSGLSIDHVIGCPLGCSYCVRHNFGAFNLVKPHLVESDEDVVRRLLRHRLFEPNVTPLRIFTQATDAMVPAVKPHLYNTMKILDDKGLQNHMLVITRYRVSQHDCDLLNSFRNLKVTLLVTYSGIKDRRIEPVCSSIAVKSLKVAHDNAESYKVLAYWRPIIAGLNDSDQDIDFALNELAKHCDGIVFSGLYQTEAIKKWFQQRGVPELYDGHTDRRKVFPDKMESRILSRLKGSFAEGKLFRKTSCGVSFAHSLPDFNAHYCVGNEICDICPEKQRRRCERVHREPNGHEVTRALEAIGRSGIELSFNGKQPIVASGISPEDRYYLRQVLGHVVEDQKFPHKTGQNGRADALRNFKSD